MRYAAVLCATVVIGAGAPAEAGSTSKLFGSAVLSTNYLIGHWAMDEAEACGGGDTLSMLASGAWAATNGTGNPVEGLGMWWVDGDKLMLTYSEFRDPATSITYTIVVSSAEQDKFSGTLDGEPVTVLRCTQ